MKTYSIKIGKELKAEWMMWEEASHQDFAQHEEHVYSIIKRLEAGKLCEIKESEVPTLIASIKYWVTALDGFCWYEDDKLKQSRLERAGMAVLDKLSKMPSSYQEFRDRYEQGVFSKFKNN